jgi:hypothetical protein
MPVADTCQVTVTSDGAASRNKVTPEVIGAALTGIVAVMMIGWAVPLDDFWLMIAAGRHLLTHGHLGSMVPLTFTPTVRHTLNGEWGAEVLFAVVHWTGLALAVSTAAIVGGLALTALRIRHRASSTATVFALLLVLAVAGTSLVPRAQSFSVFLFPFCLLLMERWRNRAWTPAAYAVAMATWANLHGAFVLGQLAVVAFLVGDLIEWRRAGAIPTGRRARRTASILVAAALAPLANPAGVGLIRYAYNQGNNRAVRTLATEWRHAFPWDPGAAPFFVLLIAFVWFRIRHRGVRPSPYEFLLGGGLTILGLYTVRSILWFVLAMAPLLAEDLDRVLTSARGRASNELSHFLIRNARKAAVAFGVGLVCVQLVRPIAPGGSGKVTSGEPVTLAAELKRNLPPNAATRIFNEQAWGGYLAFRLGDRARTFIDGRIEVPTFAVWETYFQVINGVPSAPATLERLGVRWTIVRDSHARLIAGLIGNGWTVVGRTQGGVLLAAPGFASTS